MKLKYNLKDKEAQSLLYACCYFQKKRIKVSTGLKVFTETWNVNMQRCEISNKFTDRMNRAGRKVNIFLDEVDTEWKHYIELNDPRQKYGYYSTPEFVKYTIGLIVERLHKKGIEQQEKANITPLSYFAKYVDNMTHKVDPRTGRYISERTQTHHRTVLKRIMSFMEEKHIRNDFSVFDERFAQLFTDWAYTSKNYRQNTIPATFSVLKVWLNAAKAEKLIERDDYKNYVSKSTDVDNIYLTKEEIERMYRLDIPSLISKGEIDAKSQIEITRDLFVIGCWTGLRRSDLNRLEKALFDIKKETITIITEKTSEKVSIPMHSFIKELYQKYDGRFPKLTDKTSTNKHLQEIGRHAKIDDDILVKENVGGKIVSHIFKKYQMIKMHTARRSFATNLYLDGAPMLSIMKLTGHTTEINFLKYIKISKEENAEMMRKFFN